MHGDSGPAPPCLPRVTESQVGGLSERGGCGQGAAGAEESAAGAEESGFVHHAVSGGFTKEKIDQLMTSGELAQV